MDFWIAVVLLTTVGCGTGIVITAMDKLFDGKKKAREQELKLAQERLRMQELQVIELRCQNEQLQKQLDWHAKLLEAQTQQAKQLGAASASPAIPSH
jgi:hypothetical protein